MIVKCTWVFFSAGVYVLDTCPVSGDAVDHLKRCTAGNTRILGVIDGTEQPADHRTDAHRDLPLLSVSRPFSLPPDRRARVSPTVRPQGQGESHCTTAGSG